MTRSVTTCPFLGWRPPSAAGMPRPTRPRRSKGRKDPLAWLDVAVDEAGGVGIFRRHCGRESYPAEHYRAGPKTFIGRPGRGARSFQSAFAIRLASGELRRL